MLRLLVVTDSIESRTIMLRRGMLSRPGCRITCAVETDPIAITTLFATGDFDKVVLMPFGVPGEALGDGGSGEGRVQNPAPLTVEPAELHTGIYL